MVDRYKAQYCAACVCAKSDRASHQTQLDAYGSAACIVSLMLSVAGIHACPWLAVAMGACLGFVLFRVYCMFQTLGHYRIVLSGRVLNIGYWRASLERGQHNVMVLADDVWQEGYSQLYQEHGLATQAK